MSTEYVEAPRVTGDFVIHDVTVVDVADGSRAGGQDIRISGGTIAGITPTGSATDPPAVAGNGAFVVPGFTDSHVHALNTPEQVAGAYALMLANGITGFRQMSGNPKLLADRRAGRLPAPPGAPALLATCGTLFTPLKILQSATTAPARFFGQESAVGRVAPGYRADLVLLTTDPVADHSALHDISAVVRAGALWSRADLDAILARAQANPATR